MIYLVTLLVFLTPLAKAPFASAGWLWDLGNAMGLLGSAGLLYLFLDTGVSRRQPVHQFISYSIFVCIIAHIAILWIPDSSIWHYIGTKAPNYMHSGLIGLLLILAMIVMALPAYRRFWHSHPENFQAWHYGLSLVVIVTSTWHILGSGFYFSRLEAWLFVGLTLFIVFARKVFTFQPCRVATLQLWGLPFIAIIFVLIKNLSQRFA